MNEKGISPPPKAENWITEKSITLEAWKWVQQVFSNYPRVQTFESTINPSSVSANTSEEQTFTVSGLSTSDVVIVNKPTITTGLVIGGYRVSAVDTLAITFGNLTGVGIDPPSETYRIVSIRL